jgi:2-dehydro-3-deoxyphosphogluconate aldolase/(4S)-4-hydroxy-2-oxoglutarate aldolase
MSQEIAQKTALEIKDKLQSLGLIPVLRAKSAAEAHALVEAIMLGGVTVMEVTMTVPGAIGVIRSLREKYGERLLLGAGTVLDAEQCAAAIEAGAEFIVSPSLHLDVISKTKELGKVSIPGALTPTEVVTAWKAGADYVKIFPCSAAGGASYLKALKAPLPHILLIPTGGVTVETASQYLKAGASALGVGSDLVNAAALEQGKPELITETAKKYLEVIRQERAQT